MLRPVLVAAFAAGLSPALVQAQTVAGISVPGVINLGGGIVGGVTGAAGGAIGGLSGGIGGAVGGIGGAVGGAVGGAIGGIGSTVGSVGGAVGGAVGGIGGGTVGGGGGTSGGGIGGGLGDGPGGDLGGATGPGATIALAAAGVTSFSPIDLPSALLPGGRRCTGMARTARDCRGALDPNSSLTPRPGTPTAVVQACRNTVVASSLRYGVARVDAASAGEMKVSRAGADAPIEFRMVYERQSGPEVRHATIRCRLDTAGRVVAAI